MTKFRALEAAENVVWAMEESALQTLLAIAAREHEVTPEALEAYRAKSLAGTEQAQIRNGVAIISANGPMFKRANIMTAMSGATSYEIMRQDLQAAVDGGQAKAAILNLDTPGGEASGAGELAGYIASLRGTFPVTAYVNGTAASAGYWIAAACSEIVVDAQAVLGSIGVQWAMRSREEAKGVTTHTFISSQSPMKNADPGTEEGGAHIQSVVDAMADVFVGAVAAYRGVDTQTVLSDFGKGGILVGQQAVSAGLADRIGNFEGVLAELSATRRTTKSTGTKGAKMSDEANSITAADLAAAQATARTDAVKAEKARVAGLRQVAAGFQTGDSDLTAAIDGDISVEAFSVAQAAKAAAKRDTDAAAAKTAEADRLTALKTDEEAAAKAKGAPNGDAPDEVEAMVAGISAYLPAERRATAK
jgi:ClpP class serine protease